LLELLAYDALHAIVDALGDNADNPTYEQLCDGITVLEKEGAAKEQIIALLAFAVAEAFPAAQHCRRYFDEQEGFTLPELPEAVSTPSLLSVKETDPAVKEQRRLRREEEKKKKQAQAAARLARPAKEKVVKKAAVSAPIVTEKVVAAVAEEPRRTLLTPVEAGQFNVEHPLVGTVVVVDVPFTEQDPSQPDVTSKDRPALVVAASDKGILVRAIYTNESPSRRVLGAWRRLGLDHASFIDDERTALSVTPDEARIRLGQLTTTEWNSLF
jgi:hypothetical protein